MLFQLTFLLFSLIAIAALWRQYAQQHLSLGLALAWTCFWGLANGAVWLPGETVKLANTFGIGRGVDFILYIAVAALFLLVFKLSLKLFVLEEHLTRVVRQDAIEDSLHKTDDVCE